MTCSKEKKLFTPGPLTTSTTVKQAMVCDLGSRDITFIELVANIRLALLSLAGSATGNYEAIIMQGSGTYGVESVISSSVPPEGKLLVVVNGAYGHRMVKMANYAKIPVVTLEFEENQIPDTNAIKNVLEQDQSITNVAVVHCETTTGIINPIEEIGAVVKSAGASYFVDAMSSFGAVPVDFEKCGIDFLVSSSNKCIEGVPGFSFVIAKTDSLKKIKGFARSLSLDLYDQWENLEKTGQFRFTPPVQSLLAFWQALIEIDQEGRIEGRAARYKENHSTLIEGARKMGLKEYLPPSLQGYIITTFRYPIHPNFDFETFYSLLNKRDMIIYPGKLTKATCFRIGNIGRLYPQDMKKLLEAMKQVFEEMQIPLPLT